MTKEWDKFQSDFKKLQPKLKARGLAEGEKIKKQLQADLKAAWVKEDKLREMIPKARQDGVKGDKPADFAKHKGYGAALAAWTKAVAAHRSQVKAMDVFGQTAGKLHDPWKKQHDAMLKNIKNSKEASADKKKKQDFMKKSSTTLEDLKEASNLFGTLKVPEVYYASKLPQTVEKILQESLKKSNVGELPAILDEASRNKNIRLAQKMRKSIISLCETATELATTDARKSAKSLKIASGHLDKLNKLDKQYEAAQKKQSKAINASKNKKFLLDAISRITKARNESVLRWNQAQKDIQSARG